MANMMTGLNKDLKKKYAKSNPMLVKERTDLSDLEVFSSGSDIVDAVGGIGGLCARGHVVEVFGANTSGKTTICLQTTAGAQKAGHNVVYVDAEGVLDETYARTLGNDPDADNLTILQPSNGEEFMEFLDMLAASLKPVFAKYGKKPVPLEETVSLIVVDSVAMMRSQEELEGNRRIGQHATLWSKISYKIKNMALMYNIGFVLINQVRSAPSIGGHGPAGVLDSSQNGDMSGEDTTGGTALKFLYSIRWQFKGFAKIEGAKHNVFTNVEEDVRIGNKSWATTIKNKLSPPMVKAQFAIVYGKGTVDSYALEEIMKAYGFMSNKGSWLRYECLDPALMPNQDHEEYPGYLYGKGRFLPWFETPEVQADIVKRFHLILADQDVPEVSEDNPDEAAAAAAELAESDLSFEVEEG